MLYNGFDERVGLTTVLGGSPVEVRRYVYDADHRIVGEYGATTADLRAEYIWLQPEVGEASPFGGGDGLGGYMPLAVAVPDGAASKIHWVQGNHLGTPVATTDASGAPIAPTGYARIGFPGQVEQHADLYYNYYRDYDPTLGRYVQADPIGLEGDVNPYLYAGANPLGSIDPEGLQQAPPAPDPAAVAWKAGVEHMSRQLVRPTRKIPLAGQALMAGDALGTLAAIAWYGYINPPVCRSRDDGNGRGGGRSVGGGRSMDDDEDPCDLQYDKDIGRCTAARIRFGPAGFAICAQSALDRRSQCKKGHPLEPLTGVER